MRLSDVLRTVLTDARRRPADLVPFYVFGLAVPVIARVVLLMGLVVLWLYLEVTDGIATIASGLETAGLEPPDPEESPAAFDQWTYDVVAALEPLASPEVILLLAVTISGTVLFAMVLGAVAAAGQLATCDGRLRGGRGLPAGIRGARRFWIRFLGLYLLELLLWLIVVTAVLTVAALLGGLIWLVSGEPIAGLLVGVLVLPLAVPPLAAVRAVFAFAPVSVVVDDAGILGSIRGTFGFLRSRPLHAIVYYVIAVGSLGALATVSSIFFVVGGESFFSLLQAIVLLPLLDLSKTGMFLGYRGRLGAPRPVERGLLGQVRAGLRRGWVELREFVPATPGSHALSLGALLVGFWMGWVAIEPFLDVFETSIRERLAFHIPPTAAMEFFGNNWLVALGTGFAGLALAIPALSAIWFNGVFFGAIGRTEVAPAELLAFVIPHGIFEIPAIVIAGAVGVWLGRVGWRGLSGRADAETVADAMERAFWVLVGVGYLLLIAALIEGFVSPYYWRPFL